MPRGSALARGCDAVCVFVNDLLDAVTLARFVFVRIGYQHTEAVFVGDVFYSADDGSLKGVGQVGDDKSDGLRAPGTEPLRNGVGNIAQFFNGAFDALAHVIGDVGPVANHVGDGGYGYACVIRHVFKGNFLTFLQNMYRFTKRFTNYTINNAQCQFDGFAKRVSGKSIIKSEPSDK